MAFRRDVLKVLAQFIIQRPQRHAKDRVLGEKLGRLWDAIRGITTGFSHRLRVRLFRSGANTLMWSKVWRMKNTEVLTIMYATWKHICIYSFKTSGRNASFISVRLMITAKCKRGRLYATGVRMLWHAYNYCNFIKLVLVHSYFLTCFQDVSWGSVTLQVYENVRPQLLSFLPANKAIRHKHLPEHHLNDFTITWRVISDAG